MASFLVSIVEPVMYLLPKDMGEGRVRGPVVIWSRWAWAPLWCKLWRNGRAWRQHCGSGRGQPTVWMRGSAQLAGTAGRRPSALPFLPWLFKTVPPPNTLPETQYFSAACLCPRCHPITYLIRRLCCLQVVRLSHSIAAVRCSIAADDRQQVSLSSLASDNFSSHCQNFSGRIRQNVDS